MDKLKEIFNKANDKFLFKSKQMIYDNVSERCLCSELKAFLREELNNTEYKLQLSAVNILG